MKFRVVIIGAGQLGSRYLQGLVKCNLPLEIIVVDTNEDNLIRAQERWLEVSAVRNSHSVEFLKSQNDFSYKKIDVVIIATNSKGRADLIVELSNKVEIRYWVIEKVLAQNKDELNLISDTLQNASGVWVNTPRRMITWYKNIVSETPKCSPITCTVKGTDWGLACNAIHFLDLVAWWSGEQLVSIQTAKLASHWHEAKRTGYWEVFGTLVAFYSNGSKLILNCSLDDEPYLVNVNTEGLMWDIEELNGLATNSDGKSFSGKLEHQSEITGRLIESILNTGSCELPDLTTSICLHEKLLEALLDDWNLKMANKCSKIPIT